MSGGSVDCMLDASSFGVRCCKGDWTWTIGLHESTNQHVCSIALSQTRKGFFESSWIMLSLSASSQVPQTTFASHNSQLGKLDVYGIYIYIHIISLSFVLSLIILLLSLTLLSLSVLKLLSFLSLLLWLVISVVSYWLLVVIIIIVILITILTDTIIIFIISLTIS